MATGKTNAVAGSDKITFATDVVVLAGNEIKIGDTVYTVEGMSDIYADAGTTVLSGNVLTASFSPDGSTLVLGGSFTGYAKIYAVSGTTITFVSDIYADAGTTALSAYVSEASFSPDGSTLVLGGLFARYAKVYAVSGRTITFVSNIYANAGTTALSNVVRKLSFSPDGSTLVLSGDFAGRAKIYAVSGTTITFVSDIYADAGTTALSDAGRKLSFSPDGSTLVLSGIFAGYAKVYAVSGTTITFVSDIYADAGTTALSAYASNVCFSPDGSTLVLGGQFAGRAKVYAVSGTTITFVSNIYANAGTTAISGEVFAVSFSPDGSTFVLSGNFAGRAKIYAVSGTTITFVSDIYADAGTTALSSYASTAAFSPDGSTLVLGGSFTGRAKIYAVSGTEISYGTKAYSADQGKIPEGNYNIGYARENIAQGEPGAVRLIAYPRAG